MNDLELDQGPAPLPVVVFADFVCPYSYIAQLEVDQLKQEYDVQPVWRPHWLHPEVPPEGMPRPSGADPARRTATLAWLQEMSPTMAARMRMPDKLQFSFFAFEAMEFAEDHGCADPFRAAVYDALWVEGKDIGQPATLLEVAARAGLDPDALDRALYEETYVDRTLAAVGSARRMGITGTPTIILGRTAIVGWHYYEAMQTVVEKQGLVPKSAATGEGSTKNRGGG